MGGAFIKKRGDITEEIGLKWQAQIKQLDTISRSNLQRGILEILTKAAMHVDEICRELKETPGIISAELIKMEILGVIKKLRWGQVCCFLKIENPILK